MYANQVYLINSRCLYKITLKIEAIVSIYLPSPPSQLLLFVLDTLSVDSVVRVNLPSLRSRLVLLVLDSSKSGAN